LIVNDSDQPLADLLGCCLDRLLLVDNGDSSPTASMTAKADDKLATSS